MWETGWGKPLNKKRVHTNGRDSSGSLRICRAVILFLLAMVFAGIISGIASTILTPMAAGLKYLMEQINVHPLLISLVCDVLVNVLYFACMMASFVLGITLGFNLMEETGYLARISFLFDHTMSKVGLQGKTIMPFFMGLIMELPPYHKPDLRNILYVAFQRTLDIFLRALRVITLVSIAFFVLTYGFGGSPETSILYRIGVVIEPVTMFFGLKWQAFLAFCASAISKESLLGVLNTLYGTGGSLVSSTFGAKTAGSAAGISEILSANFTKAQGLAFIFAISFNMPCVSALAATARETHSVRWTAKIGVFYTAAALLVSCIVYHIGLLVF